MNTKKQLTKEQKIEKARLLRELKIRKSRNSFWEFCKALTPKFYKEDREYLKILCQMLEDMYYNKTEKKGLTISMPPRHGKSRTVCLFAAWCIGKKKENRIMTCSYNEILATDFSKDTREIITQESSDELDIVFTDIFPSIKIKKGYNASNNWSVEGGHHTYIGGGFNSSFTGKGCEVLIIDDPVKNSDEALNEKKLDDIYNIYRDTLMSRPEGDNALTIIIQTRWSKKDLIGRVLSEVPEDFEELCYKAYNEENDKMLCDEVLSKKKYNSLKKTMSDLIFMANYNQICIDAKGCMYKNLKHYDEVPLDEYGKPRFEQIVAFIDTADKGKDYLACVVAGCYQKELYILDILYTQEPMEITEKAVARMLNANEVTIAMFESNNGGGLFSRRVNEILLNEYDTNKTIIKEQTQNKNKWTRINNTAPWLMEHMIFPQNSKHRWQEAWEHLITFSRTGKNKHDDLEDCLTALCENFGQGIKKERKLVIGNIKGV